MSGNWWADRVQGLDPQQTRTTQSVQAVQPANPAPPVPRQQKVPRSSIQDEHCPDCGSGNYQGSPGKYHRCYDCGHPIVQSGTGVGTVKTDGTVHRSVQVQGSGYQPTVIVGKVG